MTISTSNARHILLRLTDSARLPDALLASLRDEVVLSGWLRGSGVLADVQIRTIDPRAGALGQPRRLTGAVHLVVLDGSIGLSQGDVSCGMRAVLARETESGLETIAGEIVDARVVAFEGMVTALDDAAAARDVDRSGIAFIQPSNHERLAAGAPRVAAPPAPAPAPAAPPMPPPAVVAPPAAVAAPAPAPVVAPPAPSPPPPAAPAAASWSAVASAASAVSPAIEAPKPPPPKPSPTFSAGPGGPMPQRIRPIKQEEEDQPYPEPGDVVEHFAFGRCEVIKSDGDRLHVRVGKDGRVKEIALEMLKVTSLPPVEGAAGQHYKLDRKL